MSQRAPMAQKKPVAPAAMAADLASSLAGSYQMMDVDAPARKASQMRVVRSMHVKVGNHSEFNNAL